jgi:hypothetical protein
MGAGTLLRNAIDAGDRERRRRQFGREKRAVRGINFGQRRTGMTSMIARENIIGQDRSGERKKQYGDARHTADQDDQDCFIHVVRFLVSSLILIIHNRKTEIFDPAIKQKPESSVAA